MASVYKRKDKDGTKTNSWRAVVRIKGYPIVCGHFDRKQEAEDWAADVEREIKLGKFNFDRHKQQHTFTQLLDCYINDGALQYIRSAKNVSPHLDYWKAHLGNYDLIHLTPDLIGKERQYLADKPPLKGINPAPQQ
ncbi:MAG: hypothetical protein BGO14_00125 [Chlamydiales bacterium 38-26]|nr:hypothetical protein [Chlamydiales bacterium]OJV07472.1 MAG: hypothetical protein BGO14_00125 [Chlamydiales bacterium 38-26]